MRRSESSDRASARSVGGAANGSTELPRTGATGGGGVRESGPVGVAGTGGAAGDGAVDSKAESRGGSGTDEAASGGDGGVEAVRGIDGPWGGSPGAAEPPSRTSRSTTRASAITAAAASVAACNRACPSTGGDRPSWPLGPPSISPRRRSAASALVVAARTSARSAEIVPWAAATQARTSGSEPGPRSRKLGTGRGGGGGLTLTRLGLGPSRAAEMTAETCHRRSGRSAEPRRRGGRRPRWRPRPPR